VRPSLPACTASPEPLDGFGADRGYALLRRSASKTRRTRASSNSNLLRITPPPQDGSPSPILSSSSQSAATRRAPRLALLPLRLCANRPTDLPHFSFNSSCIAASLPEASSR